MHRVCEKKYESKRTKIMRKNCERRRDGGARGYFSRESLDNDCGQNAISISESLPGFGGSVGSWNTLETEKDKTTKRVPWRRKSKVLPPVNTSCLNPLYVHGTLERNRFARNRLL